MPRAPQRPVTDRRQFLKTVGLAGISSALVPPTLAMAQTSTPASGVAKPNTTTTPPAAAPTEISEDARTLAKIVERRYGQHLSPEQLAAVTREIDGRLQGGKRLRESPLANGDEPDVVFHA